MSDWSQNLLRTLTFIECLILIQHATLYYATIVLFTDFEDALAHHYDKNVEILADALMLSASVLTKQPQMVGPQIIGRLLPLLPSYEKVIVNKMRITIV